jgi:uncharacterized protein
MTFKIICKTKRTQGSILIAGFHGSGLVGYITVRHIISALKAKKVGFMLSNQLPPSITIEHGQIALPIQLYRFKKIFALLTEVALERNAIHDFSQSLVEWCIAKKFKEIIVVGGLDKAFQRRSDPEFKAIATSPLLKYLADHKLGVLDTGLQIMGPLAAILGFGEIKRFPVLAILPFSFKRRADPHAAAVAVDVLNKIYSWNIDTRKLIEDAERIERNIREIMLKREHKIEESGRMYR